MSEINCDICGDEEDYPSMIICPTCERAMRAHADRLAALDAEIEDAEERWRALCANDDLTVTEAGNYLAGLRRAREIITGAKP